MRPKQQINNSIKSIFTPYTFQVCSIAKKIVCGLFINIIFLDMVYSFIYYDEIKTLQRS